MRPGRALRRLDRWLDGRRHPVPDEKLVGKPPPVGPASERVLAGFRRKTAEQGRCRAAAANDGESVKGIREVCT